MNKIKFLFALCIGLTGCNSSSDESSSDTTKGTLEVQFPLVESLTTKDSIIVRGVLSEGITEIQVNGISANTKTHQSKGLWIAEVPLNEGDNQLVATYINDLENYSFNIANIIRNKPFLDSPKLFTDLVDNEYFYTLEEDTNTLYKVNILHNDIQLVHQFNIDDSPSDDLDDDELFKKEPDNITVNSNGDMIYYYVYSDSKFHINQISTVNAAIESLYGPDSVNYREPAFNDNFRMLFRASDNQLLIFNNDQEAAISAFDLDTKTWEDLQLPNLNTVTSGVDAEFIAFGLKDDDTIVYLADTNSENFTGEIDLSGPSATYKGDKVTVDLESECNDPEYRDSYGYTEYNHSFLIKDRRSDNFCSVNINDGITEYKTEKLGLLDSNTDGFITLGRSLYTGGENIDDYKLKVIDLDSIYPSYFIGDDINVGDPSIEVGTARDVILDTLNKKIYWIIRDTKVTSEGQIQVLDINTGLWSELGSYEDIDPEMAFLNYRENALYIFDKYTDTPFYRVDLDTGFAEPIFGLDERVALPYPDFSIESIAFDEDNQRFYLARRVDQAAANFGDFSLLVFDIGSKQLKEIVEVSDDDASKQIRASYDMLFNNETRSVYFYQSTSENPIWTVNVDTGHREVLSAENISTGPDTSNARGHSFDLINNRILSTSQDHQSVFAIDFTTGNKEFISAEDHTLGPVFTQPIGIDVSSEYQIAAVADEGLDAVYLVDLVTGERVIIQN